MTVVAQQQSRWYPSFEPSVPRSVTEAIRRLWDKLYLSLGDLGPLSVYAHGSATTFTVTTDLNAIPGLQVTLPRTGWWDITGSCTLSLSAGVGNATLSLNSSGETQKVKGYWGRAAASPTTTATISQCWRVKAVLSDVAKLQIQVDAGVTGTVNPSHCTILASFAGQ